MTPAPPRAFALLGPTASGKTALALHLAQHFPCEIISLDSALVYRGMDIGTAKPTSAERAAVPHHLIDIIDPLQHYSAADFVSDCLRLADDIGKRGRIPLIVGGTMMYFQSLTQGLNNLPSADAAIRAELHALKQQHGLSFLYNQLQEIDPDTAVRLASADSQRIERALEVWRLTGKPLSRHLAEQPAAPALALHTLALVPDHRAELHRRIAERFEAMLAQGLTDEVAELRARYPELHQELPSMRCTGYRQTWDFLDGRITYPQLREHGAAATRQLAKRQLTWLRRLPADTVLDPCALPAADLECAARDALARFQAA